MQANNPWLICLLCLQTTKNVSSNCTHQTKQSWTYLKSTWWPMSPCFIYLKTTFFVFFLVLLLSFFLCGKFPKVPCGLQRWTPSSYGQLEEFCVKTTYAKSKAWELGGILWSLWVCGFWWWYRPRTPISSWLLPQCFAPFYLSSGVPYLDLSSVPNLDFLTHSKMLCYIWTFFIICYQSLILLITLIYKIPRPPFGPTSQAKLCVVCQMKHLI